MTIVGIGSDIVAIARIAAVLQRHGERFAERILVSEEREEWRRRRGQRGVAYLASRFAAKEAFAKAMGCGIGRIAWHDIVIAKEAGGRPTLYWLHPKAAGLSIHLSLSDEVEYALAFVVISSSKTELPPHSPPLQG